MLSPLFSIAPMLKSLTATMLKTSRSYSRPKVSSSQRIAFFSDSIAWPHLSSSPRRTQIATAGWVAVRQQHRITSFVGADRHRIARHHIGTVEEISDAAEPLGLALRAVIAARHVEAGQRRVAL